VHVKTRQCGSVQLIVKRKLRNYELTPFVHANWNKALNLGPCDLWRATTRSFANGVYLVTSCVYNGVNSKEYIANERLLFVAIVY